jgi:hypothetical protein
MLIFSEQNLNGQFFFIYFPYTHKTVQVKTGYELFWRRKNFTETVLFPRHILTAKNSEGSCMETMSAAGYGLYRHLWSFAPIVHCRF